MVGTKSERKMSMPMPTTAWIRVMSDTNPCYAESLERRLFLPSSQRGQNQTGGLKLARDEIKKAGCTGEGRKVCLYAVRTQKKDPEA